MYKTLFCCVTMMWMLASCNNRRPQITVVCEENNIGNCIIKWESFPTIKGTVKVYASTHPDEIQEDTPIAICNASDGKLTIVTDDPSQRFYYLMVFDGKYGVKVASRNINIPGVQNFRDLGGYLSADKGKTVRWGKLYRAGQIDSLPLCSRQEMANIGIRTIIDLRTPQERENYAPFNDRRFKNIHIPIEAGNMEHLLKGVQEEKIKSDTIYRLIEQMNRDCVTHYQRQIKQIFHELLDPSIYPAVIHCTTGKGRTGVISALILTVLGVDEETILEDYRLSNDYFNIPKASKYAYNLPCHSQEAITTIYTAKEDFLYAAKEKMEEMYGSVNNYLIEAIGLTKEDIKQLRKNLLTPNNRF